MPESKKWVAIGCSHGNEADQDALDWSIDFIRDYKPDYIIHCGDAFDFAALRGKASEEELQISISDDLDAGYDYLKRLSDFGKIRYFLRGNHCERVFEFRQKGRAILREYAGYICKQIEYKARCYGFQMLAYGHRKGLLRLSNTTFLHGYSHAENATKQHCEKLKSNSVFCHTHAARHDVFEGWDRPYTGLNIGCLRTLEPNYAGRNLATLRWSHALGYGTFSEQKDTYNLLLK